MTSLLLLSLLCMTRGCLGYLCHLLYEDTTKDCREMGLQLWPPQSAMDRELTKRQEPQTNCITIVPVASSYSTNGITIVPVMESSSTSTPQTAFSVVVTSSFSFTSTSETSTVSVESLSFTAAPQTLTVTYITTVSTCLPTVTEYFTAPLPGPSSIYSITTSFVAVISTSGSTSGPTRFPLMTASNSSSATGAFSSIIATTLATTPGNSTMPKSVSASSACNSLASRSQVGTASSPSQAMQHPPDCSLARITLYLERSTHPQNPLLVS